MKKTFLLSFILLTVMLLFGVSANADGKLDSTFPGYSFSNYIHDEDNILTLKKDINKQIRKGSIYGEVFLNNEEVRFLGKEPRKMAPIQFYQYDLYEHVWKDAHPVQIHPSVPDVPLWNVDEFDWKLIPDVVKSAESYIDSSPYHGADILSVRFSPRRIAIQLKQSDYPEREIIYLAKPDGTFLYLLGDDVEVK